MATQASRGTRVFWYLLFLLVVFISVCWPLFNRIEPRLMGVPFFYWFQTLLVVVSAAVTALAYRAKV